MASAFHTRLQFGAARIGVRLPRDFCHNSLTNDPYPHSHPQYEVHYIASGNCTLIAGERQLYCPQGHFLLLPPRCLHRILPDGGQVQTVSFLYAVEDGVTKDVALPVCTEPVLIRDDFRGEQRLIHIRSELADSAAAYIEMIQGELMALLAAFARHCGSAVPTAQESEDDSRADVIGAYLANHRYDPDCSCVNLAREMGISTRQVHRLCIKHFDMPFRTMLSNIRMETAAYRLENSDVSVVRLAAELGYSSVESFSGAFKRHFGEAPTDRRKRKQ